MRPTDEYYNTKAEAQTKKKKGQGLVPSASVIPPDQLDWRANIDGGGAPAGVQNPGLVNPTPGDQEAIRHRIELNRRLRDLGSQQGILVGTPTSGLSPGDKMARAEAISTRGDQMDNIRGALAPVQKVQDPTGVMNARNSIQDSLLKNLLQQREEITRRMNADRENAPKYQEELNQNADAMHQAQARLPKFNLESPEIKPIIQGQMDLRQAQMDRRSVYAGNAGADLAAEKERIAQQNDIETKGRQLMGSQLDAEIAQNQAAADPETIKAQLERQRVEERAKSATSNRAAAYSVAGLGSEEAFNQFRQRAGQEVTAADEASFGRNTLPVLQSLFQNDPTEASRLANDLIGEVERAMPSPLMSAIPEWGGQVGTLIGRNARVKTENLRKIRSWLERYVQPIQ